MAVWAAFKKKGLKCVTAQLNVRIKNAMKVDDEYIARGKVTNIKHKLVQAESEIINKNNKLIAFAKVRLIKID
jgi:acyl-CoA thioesterase FadM